MTFRGIIVDGLIVPGSDLRLPDGAEVEFELVRQKPRRSKSTRAPRPQGRKRASTRWILRGKPRILTNPEQARLTKAQRVALVMAAYGTWKDRPEWKGKSSAQIALELRRIASQRNTHG